MEVKYYSNEAEISTEIEGENCKVLKNLQKCDLRLIFNLCGNFDPFILDNLWSILSFVFGQMSIFSTF